MAMSNKPIVWLPFAAGGMIVALVLSGVMILVLLTTLGALGPDAMAYQRVSAFAANPVGALLIFIVIALSLWHAAHRLRMTVQDLGVRGHVARRLLAWACYVLASLGTLLLLLMLARV